MINMNVTDLASVYRQSSDLTTDKIENSKDDQELMESCKDFESYFISLMLKEMRKTINYSDGYIKRSRGEEVFTELLDEQIGKDAASGTNGMGLAQVLYEQMKKRS